MIMSCTFLMHQIMKAYIIDFEDKPRHSPYLIRKLAPMDIEGVVVPAVDGTLDKKEYLIPPDDEGFQKKCSRPMVPGEIGCFNSHANICKAALDGKLEPSHPYGWFLVLEDDAEPLKGFSAHFVSQCVVEAQRLGALFVNLGPQPVRSFRPGKRTIPGVIRLETLPPKVPCFRTHAVLYSMEACKRVLRTNTIREPYDNHMLTLFRQDGEYAYAQPPTRIWFRPSVECITKYRKQVVQEARNATLDSKRKNKNNAKKTEDPKARSPEDQKRR